MATRNIVPRADKEGKLGTQDKKWAEVNADTINAATKIDAPNIVDKSAFEAKGDILVASGAGAPDNLSVGSDGNVLIADSNSPLGVKWGTVSGGGGASSLGDLSDVDIATKSDGDVLTYVASASKWKAVAPSTGGGASSLADLSDVDIGTKTDGDALVYVGADEEWQAVNLRKVNEVIKSSTATLTTAEVTGTIINNYGQDDDTTLTLPTATKGLTFMVVLGTEVSKYFRIKPDTNDKIYLSGTAGADGGYVGVSSAKIGNTISFTSFKTGTDTYDWLAVSIAGDWSAET